MSTTTQSTTSDPSPSASPSSALATIQAVYAAFGRGDIPALLDLIADDVDWGRTIAATGGEIVPHLTHGVGKAAAIAYFQAVGSTMEFHQFSPRLFFASGASVAVVLDLDITVRTTGRRVAFDEVHLFEVRDGRIVQYRPFVDTAQMMQAYGGAAS